MQPAKVKFKKIQDSNTLYESHGYYNNQNDFKNRNPNLFFNSMTKKIKPELKQKEKQ